MTDSEWQLDTLAIRAGQIRTAEGEHAEPIFPTSSFVFNNAAEAAARFANEEPGNIYSRFTNPTVRTFEQRLAAMEGGEQGIATASGMAAVLSLCLATLQAGEQIVVSKSLFGTTTSLFNNIMQKFGVEIVAVPLTDLDAWRSAVQPKTKFLFLETPSNPLSEIADIPALAEIAHRYSNDCLLVVDNCFCTPALQRPLALGADTIIHSATKFLDGQGRCVGGAVVGSEELIQGKIYPILRTAGPTLSPFNAWVFLKGLETLSIRMQAHSRNALAVAQWLQQQPAVERVHYSGLESHPQHALASSQQQGFGGIVSFEVAGGREAAWRVIDATQMLSITANLGDVKTTITHPATTTHGRLSEEQRQAAGIQQNLIRLSVGLEAIEDIQGDLLRGLSSYS